MIFERNTLFVKKNYLNEQLGADIFISHAEVLFCREITQ